MWPLIGNAFLSTVLVSCLRAGPSHGVALLSGGSGQSSDKPQPLSHPSTLICHGAVLGRHAGDREGQTDTAQTRHPPGWLQVPTYRAHERNVSYDPQGRRRALWEKK